MFVENSKCFTVKTHKPLHEKRCCYKAFNGSKLRASIWWQKLSNVKYVNLKQDEYLVPTLLTRKYFFLKLQTFYLTSTIFSRDDVNCYKLYAFKINPQQNLIQKLHTEQSCIFKVDSRCTQGQVKNSHKSFFRVQ